MRVTEPVDVCEPDPDADIETVPLADAHALAVPPTNAGAHGPSANAGAPYLLSQ